ncbi:uncharacterized protein LOC111694702 [Eurytemora carolleeae]|uniref:uncharacterized protein LOC111694702 n=1 Tax=Eurytemora carolleeae TaxID=1294199 RepID=UPI000C7875A5|nr:uncharacterized protein LOC111694702 [Eurytemora carolleeae]|eukprot:XP_023319459.1 uncharacterized protein LOC111694702 [Eurytemora affinis]
MFLIFLLLPFGLSSADNWVKEIQTANQNSFTCEMCELTSIYVREFVLNNSTAENLQKVLSEFCNMLYKKNSEKKTECKIISQNMSLDLTQFLQHVFQDESALCTSLSACSSPSEKMTKVNLSMLGYESCSICKYVLNSLQNSVSNATNVEAIKQTLYPFCFAEKACENYLDEVFEDLENKLRNPLFSQSVCKTIEACDPEDPERNRVKPDLKIRKEKIKNQLFAFCSIEYDVSVCESYVAEYTDRIEKMLRDKISADLICQELNFCAKSLLKKDSEYPARPAQSSNEETCKLCEKNMRTAFLKILNKDNLALIDKTVLPICSYPWFKDSTVCTTAISNLGPKILAGLIRIVCTR